MPTTELLRVALFEGKHIRKVIHEGEWCFSVVDVIEVLTGSDRPRKYWNDLKKKLVAEGYLELSEKIGQLKMPARGMQLFFIREGAFSCKSVSRDGATTRRQAKNNGLVSDKKQGFYGLRILVASWRRCVRRNRVFKRIP